MRLRVRQEDLEWRRVGDEVVILDLRAREYFSLNETGTALWPLLERGSSREELVAELQTAFGVSAETAAQDVDAFVADLRERALVDA